MGKYTDGLNPLSPVQIQAYNDGWKGVKYIAQGYEYRNAYLCADRDKSVLKNVLHTLRSKDLKDKLQVFIDGVKL